MLEHFAQFYQKSTATNQLHLFLQSNAKNCGTTIQYYYYSSSYFYVYFDELNCVEEKGEEEIDDDDKHEGELALFSVQFYVAS